jgi:Ras-related protein Rab-18
MILVYDVSNRSSFENLEHWLLEVDTYCTRSDAVKMLVGNKIDTVSHLNFIFTFGNYDEYQKFKENRTVSREEGLLFARKHRMLFIEASAKTREGVQMAFEELVQKVSPQLFFDKQISSFRSSKHPDFGSRTWPCAGICSCEKAAKRA